jgi:tRNA A-37 threonylcarbamoyl transferase component Bud32
MTSAASADPDPPMDDQSKPPGAAYPPARGATAAVPTHAQAADPDATRIHTPGNPNADAVALKSPSGSSDAGSTRAAGGDFIAGKRVGDYELLDELARGGMGVVYKARHEKLGRSVALKMIKAGELASRSEVVRFQAEAEAAARLEHPNIVPIYDVGEYTGQPFYSMRFYDGGNLASALPALRKNPQAAARLLATVARAVHHAHQHGILHRDIKPANILLDAEGQPHVTDFGLAKRFEGDSRLTQSGAVMGTPSYIPPEQASGKRGQVSTASDVYSLGAILYEALTGRPPFQAETVAETLVQVLEHEADRPTAIDPRIDRDLETICLKCLQKEPGERYHSAAALADDVDRWLRGDPIEARPATPLERMRKWARRRPAIVALLGLVAGITLVSFVTVVSLWREAVRQQHLARTEATRAMQQAAIAEQQTLLARHETRKRVEAEQIANVGLEALGSLAKTTARARDVIQNLWSAGNLQSIGQALIAYHEQQGRFPDAVIEGADGRPLLSWRVAILPFLGLDELYRQFHLDEPWDSPHNHALLDQMPPVFRAMSSEPDPSAVTQVVRAGRVVDPMRGGILARIPRLVEAFSSSEPGIDQSLTYYRAVMGPGTMFEDRAGRHRSEAVDGPEQTILVVEAAHPVPWTKPDEVVIDADAPWSGIVSDDDLDGTQALFADGSVRRLPHRFPGERLYKYFTRAGDSMPRETLP